jgi:hypothetical protein
MQSSAGIDLMADASSILVLFALGSAVVIVFVLNFHSKRDQRAEGSYWGGSSCFKRCVDLNRAQI